MLLMEVLIALALIALCAFPLIAPHTSILTEQKKFVATMELDHDVNLFYAEILERLYRNEISRKDIAEKRIFSIDEEMIKHAKNDKPFSFDGVYSFAETDYKSDDAKAWGVYLVNLQLVFFPKEFANSSDEIKNKNSLRYNYKVFIAYLPEKADANSDPAPDKKEEK